MGLEVVTPPAAPALTVIEAEQWLRVDAGSETALLTDLIQAATAWCEEHAGVALIERTLRLHLDAWPEGDEPIRLPMPPAKSVSLVRYYDEANTLQTMPAEDYILDTVSRPGRLTAAPGKTWPAIAQRINAVQVTFVAGYGTTAAAVPQRARQAIRFLVGHFYENREEVLTGTISKRIEMAARDLMGQLWHGRIDVGGT